MGKSIAAIISLMEDFTQPAESSDDILNMVYRDEDEFITYEVVYLFQRLLGMKVWYKPLEKVAFILFMRYKETDIAYVLSKLSFKFYQREIDEHDEIYNEIKEKIRNAIRLSQYEFKKDVERSIGDREVIFPNYTIRFERAFECLEVQVESNLNGGIDWPQYLHRADCFINSYALHLVSYMEHVLTLLYPFSESYDAQLDIKSFVTQNVSNKMESLFSGLPSDDMQIKDKLSQITKYVRNPIAHGYLTRAYLGDVLIPGIGYIPMSYSNYSLSTQNYPIIPVNLKHQYSEMREIKGSFDNLVEKLYPNATTIIKAGLDIKCDPKSRKKYMSVINNSDDTRDFILRELHRVYATINMEW